MSTNLADEAALFRRAREEFTQEVEAKGVPVQHLNPTATLAEKGAQHMEHMTQNLAPKSPTGLADTLFPESAGGKPALKVVADALPGKFNVPTIMVEDSDAANAQKAIKDTLKIVTDAKPAAKATAEGKTPVTSSSGTPTPTANTKQVVPPIPDWYIVGWRQMLGIDKPPVPTTEISPEEKDKNILNNFISDQFYVQWLQNAGVIVFAILSTHVLSFLGFGFGWIFPILGICYTQHTTNIQRFERAARDDMIREMVHTNQGPDTVNFPHESVEWMNQFLQRFWYIYMPVLNKTISTTVDMVLVYSTPAFLDSMKLTDFTLGNKAPRIDKVWTMRRVSSKAASKRDGDANENANAKDAEEEVNGEDIVEWEWDISFTPDDTKEMTVGQAETQVSPRVLLHVRLGKGFATAALPILVEGISLKGRMKIRMKLAAAFPYVQILDFCFMTPPEINYVLKPIGGETFGFDIASIPGLSTFIQDTTHGILGPMMYHPNIYRLNLEQMMSGKPLQSAIGVLEVRINSGRGIKGGSIADSTPDPFVALSIDDKPEIEKTKWKENTHNPSWMEVKYLLLTKLEGKLNMHVYDFNERRQNLKIGSAVFDLSVLNGEPVQEGLSAPFMDGEKERGELRYGLTWYPCRDEEAELKKKLQREAEKEKEKEKIARDVEGGEVEGESVVDEPVLEQEEESTIGVVRLVVHQAKDLGGGEPNPLAKIYLNHSSKPVFSTVPYKRSSSPYWEAPYEYLCSSRDTDVVTVKVVNDRDFVSDPVMGHVSVKLQDLLEYKKSGKDWFPLSGCKTGQLRVSAIWKPVVATEGNLASMGKYHAPIGVVRIWIQKATNVKNLESLGGKSDPYVRVLNRNAVKGKTAVVDNNLNPVWDEILYVPVHSLRESVMLECMDHEVITKDRPLGCVDLRVSDLARKTGNPKAPFASTGPRKAADPLVFLEKKKATTGVLHYEATFIPADNFPITFNATGAGQTKKTDKEEGGGYVDEEEEDDHSEAVALTVKSLKRSSMVVLDSAGVTPVTPAVGYSSLANGPPSTQAPPPETLFKQQSGIAVFHIVSGQLAKTGRIEVLMDDGDWPALSTAKSRSTEARWDFVGEGFVKEIDFSQVHVFLDAADEEGKDYILAEWSGPVKELLRDTVDGTKEIVLVDKNGRNESRIVVEVRYIPVPIVLEPRESVNNQGTLRVKLVDGRDLRAVDRGGKSDPYAVFTLGGEKVFKSQTHKKTIEPVWNEDFEVSIPSRAAADFQIELFDWNQIEQDKSIGVGRINLADLEAFKLSEREVVLSTGKYGEKGVVRVQMLFQPRIIAKERKNTATFVGAGGRAMTSLGAAPVSVGKGVIQGVTSVFKRD
ncbi:hypothetical protein FA15DRAFT_668641 [Coprinopsis marcescibilis]|uniref:Tricalbin n=1 Tax=Coprinopsis marcescibilis TaxID=230819 RepID=A0A5C3KX80_COPMA|nr:hypothetical protein FA15DRAFT_668641 [Coprinopsis marcescibilis]